ncbi:MAG TPA: MlaE family lipid ABC transporter permease subunit [Spirochaetia bacterium]|nr:MlaE family lipid ABC transporter permease subunit [Spirochaetia bacterium]
MMRLDDHRLVLRGDVTRDAVPQLHRDYRKLKARVDEIDLSEVETIDSAGVAFLEYVREHEPSEPRYDGADARVQHVLDLFARGEQPPSVQISRPGWLERLGAAIIENGRSTVDFVHLSANITAWTLLAPFDRRSRRRGSIRQQCEAIGVRAVPIVAVLSLILGVIVVLQSAAQLRQFGASLLVADLLSISVTRETGPLFTAIIVAGRSGSAITAQLATMKVTEELDALRVMALDPLRYVIVPMMAAMLLTIPLLTALSILVGIAGGTAVAAVSLSLSVGAFFNRIIEIVSGLDLFVGIAKSFSFGAAIVLVSSHFGLTSTGGSEGVGRSTTRSVVVSIFGVILLNAIFSLLYLV